MLLEHTTNTCSYTTHIHTISNMTYFCSPNYLGPHILLELCDETLRDWLKNIGTVTDELEDNMVNFCTDIARGMKHLHQNQVGRVDTKHYVQPNK